MNSNNNTKWIKNRQTYRQNNTIESRDTAIGLLAAADERVRQYINNNLINKLFKKSP